MVSNQIQKFLGFSEARSIRLFRLACMALLVIAASVRAHADTLADQRKVHEQSLENAEYRLALSSLKKVNAITVAEKEYLLRGNVERQTLEIDSAKSDEAAWALLQQYFSNKKPQLIFSCSGLACGSSNAWANEQFNIRQLYGLDQSQRYAVYRFTEHSNTFAVLYLVRQGNRRLYAQIDIIAAQGELPNISMSPSTIEQILNEQGYFTVAQSKSGRALALSDEQVKAIFSVLAKKPHLKYFVVGHAYSRKTHKENETYGLELATALSERLLALGLSASQITVASAGAYAPRMLRERDRVELVPAQ